MQGFSSWGFFGPVCSEKVTTYGKKQKNVAGNPDKNQSIETNSEMAHTDHLVYRLLSSLY